MGVLILGVNTLYTVFCFFKLFIIVAKELISSILFSLLTPFDKYVFLCCNTNPFINGCVARYVHTSFTLKAARLVCVRAIKWCKVLFPSLPFLPLT